MVTRAVPGLPLPAVIPPPLLCQPASGCLLLCLHTLLRASCYAPFSLLSLPLLLPACLAFLCLLLTILSLRARLFSRHPSCLPLSASTSPRAP